MEEQKNLLVSEDDLITEPINTNSNLENGYTEELDFSNLTNEINNQSFNEQVVEPIPSVPLEPIYEEYNNVDVSNNIESSNVENVENVSSEIDNTVLDKKINENPMGKIKYKTGVEEVEQEKIDPSTIKLDFKGNNNLKYVIILGMILLFAVFAIPFIITHR